MWKQLSILGCFFSIAINISYAYAQPEQGATHIPGPHIINVDYEKLFGMKEPPTYKPLEVYGMFLMSEAERHYVE